MIQQRPGQKVFTVLGPDWGVQVIEPGPQVAAGGWWDDFGAIGCCIGAWQGKAAANYAASLLDLSGNGNNLTQTAGVVPWNAANGWQFVAALLQLLDTNLVPASGWSMLCQFANFAPNATKPAVMGEWTANARFFLQPDDNLANRVYGSGGFTQIGGGVVTGNMGIGGQQGYLNGAPDGAPTAAWGAVAVPTVVIGGLSVPAYRYADVDVYAASMYNCTLNAAEMAAVAANMAAL